VVGYIPSFVDAMMTELGATYTWHAVPDSTLPQLFDLLDNHTQANGLDLWVAPRLPQGSYKGNNMFGWQYGTNMATSHVRGRLPTVPSCPRPLQVNSESTGDCTRVLLLLGVPGVMAQVAT